VELRENSACHSVGCDNLCRPRDHDGLLIITHSTVDAGVCHTLRLKLHQFEFSPCLLQTCLYNIYWQQIEQVEF